MERVIGAFVFPDVWQVWSATEAQQNLDSLAEMGVNAIFTEAESYRDDLIELSHRFGLKWFGSISCFSDHAHQNQVVKDRPELRPVDEEGNLRPQMEWYVGVTPTFDDYNASRLELAEQLVRNHDLDGLFLDFIRWSIHWELEIRPGAGPPRQYSFDPHTLARFREETGVSWPESLSSIQEKARWILANHQTLWVDFKCRTITRFVAQASKRLRPLRSKEFKLGVYTLPMPAAELEAIAGQRIGDLAPLVDLVAPMTYHAIVHRPISWVIDVIDWASNSAFGKILPVLQDDSAEGAEMGADWGPPIPVEEWDRLLKKVLETPGISGLVAFTGTALFRDGRGTVLKNNISF